MKKVLAYIGIVFMLSTSGALAQVDTTTSCSVVGSGNYSACCGLAATADNTAACKYYEQVMQIICKNITSKDTYNTCCGSNSVIRQQNEASCSSYEAAAQAAGTVGSQGATQNTNPRNIDTTATRGSAIGPTPQSSSSTLASCNAIRFDSLLDILIWIKCVIGAVIIPLLFTAAFLVFLIGVIRFIRSSDNQAKRDEYKRFMFIGIIGLTVMVSVWGIVRIVTSTFGLGNTVPQLQTDCLTTDKNNPCR